MARRRSSGSSTDIVKVSVALFIIIAAAFYLGATPNLDIAKATGFGSALNPKE